VSPERSKVCSLPEGIKAELEKKLVGNGFRDYVQLEEWLNLQGFEISKSAIHRYGQNLERQLSAIKASTEAARLISEAAPDEKGDLNAAAISLIQSGMFEALLAYAEAEGALPEDRVKLLSRSAKAIAEITHASVSQKKWAEEISVKIMKTANEVKTLLTKESTSEEVIKRTCDKILGIANG